MQRIIVATKNKGKLKELEGPLKDLGFTVETLPDDYADIVEDGTTFEENSLIKARFVCKDLNLAALADDSGLSVDALDGAPGIYSARYAHDYESLTLESGQIETQDCKNIRKLLDKTKDIPTEQRTCAFHCAMSLVFPNGKEVVVHETWQGKLLFAPQGQNGFGYDPIFFDEELQLSAAELDKETKNQRSHRGKALRSLMEALKKESF